MTRLLHGPILATLLTLAAPNVLALLMQVAVSVAETVYIGRLGTTSLAAMALVFPFLMLAQQLSAGAMGGGVSSAVSRALGAGDSARAGLLALHALVIGTLLGLLFTGVMLTFGPTFYRWLGGQGAVLDAAIGYSGVLFLGALLVWLGNTLASVLRGTGNMRVPAISLTASALLQITLGALLAFGAGPLPGLGMAGVALAFIVASGLNVAVFSTYLLGGHARLVLPPLRQWPRSLRREMFADILKVGALSMLSPLQSVLTVVILTGLVARLGVLPLAGYSIGQRLEFMLIPIAFGIGVAAVPMVGLARGRGQVARARRVAWTAGAASAFNLALIGGVVALTPDLWATLFSADEAVLGYARQYLRTAGPAFAFFGIGLTLYFASQGAGQMLGPVLAGTARLVLVAGGGAWLVAGPGATAQALFLLVAASMVVYGLATLLVVRLARWR